MGTSCIFMLFLRHYILFLCRIEDSNEESVFGKVDFQHENELIIIHYLLKIWAL